MEGSDATLDTVKEYYGKTMHEIEKQPTQCSMRGKPFYKSAREALDEVHPDVVKKYYGCGNPIPGCLPGTTIVDLGCGSGRDVFICSKLVGENGSVIGIDMTQEQLDIAQGYAEYHREKFGYSNVKFVQGYIEDFVDTNAVEPNSADIVISNCVICLSPNKPKVFEQAWKALKEGGELYFSDIYSDRRIPTDVQQDKVLWNEGYGGSMYIEDFRREMSKIGFKHLQVACCNKYSNEYGKGLNQNYYSITFRAFKITSLEDKSEDYQIEATYLGGIPDFDEEVELDVNYKFAKDKPVRVCRNTAEILRKSRFAQYFSVTEDKAHQGLFETQSLDKSLESLSSTKCKPKASCSG